MAIVIYYRVYLVVTLNNSSKYYMNYYIWYYMVTANCINKIVTGACVYRKVL